MGTPNPLCVQRLNELAHQLEANAAALEADTRSAGLGWWQDSLLTHQVLAGAVRAAAKGHAPAASYNNSITELANLLNTAGERVRGQAYMGVLAWVHLLTSVEGQVDTEGNIRVGALRLRPSYTVSEDRVHLEVSEGRTTWQISPDDLNEAQGELYLILREKGISIAEAHTCAQETIPSTQQTSQPAASFCPNPQPPTL